MSIKELERACDKTNAAVMRAELDSDMDAFHKAMDSHKVNRAALLDAQLQAGPSAREIRAIARANRGWID